VHTHAHSRNDSYRKRLRNSVLSAADADALNFCRSRGGFSSKFADVLAPRGLTDDQKTGVIRQSGEKRPLSLPRARGVVGNRHP
jgi:hypothetical protein